jgi:hypothetical protein
MSEGILYIAPHELGLNLRRTADERPWRTEQEPPLAPWFVDNAVLRDARTGPLDRERRFRGALDELMELFASSQITPLEFRRRLLGLLSQR